MSTMKRWSLRIALGLVAVLIVIQLIPVQRENPPEHNTATMTPAVEAVLRQSCYDCHSNQTVWPWYSAVAPMSWIVADHVEEGREELNFSNWDSFSAKKKAHIADESLEEIEDGEMPLWDYELAHGDAKLSPEDVTVLKDWMTTLAAAAPAGGEDEHGEHGEHDHD